jgi:hypothetical protein
MRNPVRDICKTIAAREALNRDLARSQVFRRRRELTEGEKRLMCDAQNAAMQQQMNAYNAPLQAQAHP